MENKNMPSKIINLVDKEKLVKAKDGNMYPLRRKIAAIFTNEHGGRPRIAWDFLPIPTNGYHEIVDVKDLEKKQDETASNGT